MLHLVADDGEQDVVVVRAAPAQDVHALLVAFLFELMNGVLGAAGNTRHVTYGHVVMWSQARRGIFIRRKTIMALPDWSMTSLA